ncbi:MAG: SDR family oxidoreductase [Bacteroidetes bacterium]|nr:MAG: SDR family oxidoreductase [Bacteroidota bacterium]
MKKFVFDDLNGKVCVITGGRGVIGKSLCEGLLSSGVKIAITGRNKSQVEKAASALQKKYKVKCIGVEANILDKESLLRAKEHINKKLGTIDFLINCAGGNSPKATTKMETMQKESKSNLEQSFFGLDINGFREVFDLNFLGTVLPTMIFSQDMVAKGGGVILNVSSMNSFRPLTKIPAYSAAKASINNFTEWLAVHLAGVNIRVNAIAPGFFLTDQNRFLLVDEKTGRLTPRGNKILAATPMGRFGTPEELQGITLFLLSESSRFITGVVIPVDGGFNAYSGV